MFSTENCWTPISFIVFLDALNFLNHWRVLHKFFGTVTQKGSTESWYPYYPKHFDTRIFLKHRRVGFDYDYFWRCETKNFHKVVIPLLSKNFWYQNISERQKGSPTMFFGDLRQKNFDGKTWHSLLIHIFFRTRKFLKHKSVPPRCFSVLWD